MIFFLLSHLLIGVCAIGIVILSPSRQKAAKGEVGMSKLDDWKLTDAELHKAADSTGNGTYGEGLRAVADAATAKALRGVVAWLRAFNGAEQLRTQVPQWSTLRWAADELEAMLKEDQGRG